MSASVAAAGAAAIAYYAYSRSRRVGGRDVIETHTSVEQAPNDWTGELFLFAEGLRYLYFETVARWPTADLFIGLVYLARQGLKDFPAKQVVAHGKRSNLRSLCGGEASKMKDDLLVLRRLLLYSQNLKFSRPVLLQEVWSELDLKPEDFLIYQPKAAVLKPAYVLVKDEKLKSVVLAVRGTHSVKDIFTSLTGACKPHHMVSSDGVVLGHSHFGMLAGARWILKETAPTIEAALAANPGYTLRITGHSMGGGAAAMLTMIIRAQYPSFGDAHCTSFACPGCMTLEIAKSCSDYVTTVVYGTDVVPTLSPAALDLLREDVAQSSWAHAFRKDVRSSNVVQAVEGRVRGLVASVSSLTITGLKGCYGGARKGGGSETTQEKSGSECDVLLGSESMRGEMEEGGRCCSTDGGCREIPVLDHSQQGKKTLLPVSNNAGLWEENQLMRELAEASQEITTESSDEEGPNQIAEGAAGRSSSFRDRISKFSSAFGGATQPRANAIAQWGKQTSFTVAQGAGSLWSQMWFRKQKLKNMNPDGEGDESRDDTTAVPPGSEASMPMDSSDVQGALENEEVEGVFDGRSVCNRDDIDDQEIEAQFGEGSVPHEVLWKRQLYPAGRILHLVPAFILNADHSVSPVVSDSEQPEDGVEIDGLLDGEGTSGDWYHPKESDLDREGGLIDENEKYVLFSDVPQEAYNRVRMSRSMVGDHFVPRYRGAIESLIEYLDETREAVL
ncbi:hypothetical protein BSKO_11956 [Bryopsis sp. KO-2023]|nr:hypothetical protein BSKO_11956 [Bryopsis sp. KO-2023]